MIKLFRKKNNTKKLQIASLKEELLETYRNLERKNQLIMELLEIRNTQEFHIQELNKEIKELREKKVKKVK